MERSAVSVAISIVDAFTHEPFTGNPAGVCVLPGPVPERWMNMVARELNLSETAFLYPEGSGYRLRWFTPVVEIELCGHATLAAGHVLWESGLLAPQAPALFTTLSGELTAVRHGGWIQLDFPAKPATAAEPPTGLKEALQGRALVEVVANGADYLVEVESENVVRTLEPDFTAIERLPLRGVIVTARAVGRPYDFVSRFFAPGFGAAEDHVTGFAHCFLGPYWQRKLGRSTLVGYQASRRGGYVRVVAAGERVLLGGQAVTVLKGSLLADPGLS